MSSSISDQELPFIVVGGGIGGCASALMLARQGRQVLLLEQADAFKEIGAGIQLGPNAFRVFDLLGISEAVEKSVVYPEHLTMMDGMTGQTVTSMKMGAPFISRFGKPYGVIYRADLHEALIQACRKQNNIVMQTQCRVVDFKDHGDHVVLHTADGGQRVGAALIGCDGLWSCVRKRLLDDGAPRVSGHIAYRAVLPMEQVPEHLRSNDMVLWAGAKNHLVQYPLRRGELFNLVAVFHSDKYVEGWDAKADSAELFKRFADNCEQVKQLLSLIETWRMWVLCDREPVREWTKGRVTLLGDAAHPMLQYMAQGAAMAMEDAVCLARELGAGGSVQEALLRYQEHRYLRTGRVQLTARMYGEAYHAAGVTRELRNQMLAPRSAEQAYESLSWLYDYDDF